MTDRLRVGVIGAGAWAVASHIPNLADRDDVDLVAVNRRDDEALRRVQERFGFAYASPDYRDVLEHDLDLVVVSSPAAFHYEHAKAALAAGAHLVVEKPFTIDPAQAWELVDLADSLGRHLVLALGWHYKPIVATAKTLMEVGTVGVIEHVSISMSSPIRDVFVGKPPQFVQGGQGGAIIGNGAPSDPDLISQDSTNLDVNISGGGYGQAQLSHALGLGLWLTSLSAESVYALMTGPSDAAIEFHDAMVVRYTSGAIGTISGSSSHSGANHNKHRAEVHAVGERGELLLDLGRDELWEISAGHGERQHAFRPGAGDYDCDGPINAACDLISGRISENVASGEIGARTVDLLAAAYRSAASGHAEEVPGGSNARQRPAS